MNLESLLLRGLGGASVLLCGLILAAMVSASPASTAVVATAHPIVATAAAMPTSDTGHAG